MTKATFTARLGDKHRQALEENFPKIQFRFFDSISDAEDVLGDTEILVTYGEDLTEDLILERLPKLKWIQVISAGLDQMPFSALKHRNIIVSNARGIHQIPMAEYTIGAMLQVNRRMNEVYMKQKASEWDRSVRVEELHGKTLGIVGVGAIGAKIAEYAKCMGMTVLGMNRSGKSAPNVDQLYKQEELNVLLGQSDFVVVVVPYTPETEKLIGETQLAAMKSSAYLINIARGSVVDEKALLKVLEQKRIAGAVLDVFTEEPLPSNHPFWQMENVIITPHMSGRSPKYMERAMEIFHGNIPLYLSGEEPLQNQIDLNKGY